MTIGTSKQAYGEPSYRDNRYSHDIRPFDWYQKHAALAPLLNHYLRRDGRILLVGCGNSGQISAPPHLIHSHFSWLSPDPIANDPDAFKAERSQCGDLDSSLEIMAYRPFAENNQILTALGEGMVNDGFKDVVNIDISSVIDVKMDVQDMNGFETGSFDAVIDKGTAL
ncbi:hypothetical protein ACLOJK_021990 [Asimina triloba]